MDIADFRTVIALVESGSITAAANLLCRVPSAITARLQNIESQLGTTLFVRANRRFIPTAEARTLYEHALQIMQLVATAEQQVAQPVPGGRFRLGALDSMAATRLPAPLAALYRLHRDIAIELETGTSRDLCDAVLEHRLDAAFVADARADDRLERMAVFEETLVIITASGFPPVTSAEDLQRETLLVFRDGCSYRDRLTSWFSQHQLRPHRLAEMSSYHAILGGVSAGMGIGVVPEPLLSTFPAPMPVEVHPFDSSGSRIVTELVWRKEGLTANTRALIEIVSGAPVSPDYCDKQDI